MILTVPFTGGLWRLRFEFERRHVVAPSRLRIVYPDRRDASVNAAPLGTGAPAVHAGRAARLSLPPDHGAWPRPGQPFL